MKAVEFTEPGKYRFVRAPRPTPGRDQVLVQVKSTTICGTDLKIFKGAFPGVQYPHIPGHEFGGEVVEVGEGVTNVKHGDRVGVEVHVGCGTCPRCMEGMYNLCENYGVHETGHAHVGFTTHGGLAEYCVVPARAAHRLPDGLDFDHGAFTDTLSIALWAVERAGGVRAGESVVVLGPGALGLLAMQIARVQGSGQLVVCGTQKDADRLRLARKLGADYIIDVEAGDAVEGVRQLTRGKGADLVIEFAGTGQAAQQAINMARRGGRVVLGGSTSPGRRLDIDLSTIVRGQLSLFGSVANPRGISRRANLPFAHVWHDASAHGGLSEHGLGG